jgi:hypothetical protein
LGRTNDIKFLAVSPLTAVPSQLFSFSSSGACSPKAWARQGQTKLATVPPPRQRHRRQHRSNPVTGESHGFDTYAGFFRRSCEQKPAGKICMASHRRSRARGQKSSGTRWGANNVHLALSHRFAVLGLDATRKKSERALRSDEGRRRETIGKSGMADGSGWGRGGRERESFPTSDARKSRQTRAFLFFVTQSQARVRTYLARAVRTIFPKLTDLIYGCYDLKYFIGRRLPAYFYNSLAMVLQRAKARQLLIASFS